MFRSIIPLLLTIFVVAFSANAKEVPARASAGVNFSLTEVSTQTLQSISKTVHDAFQNETSFDQGCEARAHLISQYLVRKNIHNGLLYVQEHLLPVANPRTRESLTWAYHVAVVLLGDDQELYVIDPFFDQNLFKAVDWLNLTTSVKKARFAEGSIRHSRSKGQIDWVAPYFWTPPYQMSQQMISETNHFDDHEFNKAKKLYPQASTALGL